jgi:hypothetical protein
MQALDELFNQIVCPPPIIEEEFESDSESGE